MKLAAAVAVTLAAGCYSPSPPGGVPCSLAGECPSGQVCVDGVCSSETGSGGVDSAVSDDGPVVDGSFGDATPDDASPNACPANDNTCLVACLDSDPDCNTTCGDGRCVGNAGELCTTCEADCKTLDAVCGNGHCDDGESPDCYADCGPTPWQWTDLEAELLSKINQKRVMGWACPSSLVTTAPALATSSALLPAARDWVWEIAHHEFVQTGGGACNGRKFADRQMPVDFDYAANGRGYATVQAAIDGWFANASICPNLMDAQKTIAATAVAYDKMKVYLVLLE